MTIRLAGLALALGVACPAMAQLTISSPQLSSNGSYLDFATGDRINFVADNKDLQIVGVGGLPRLHVSLNSFSTPGGGFFFLHNLVTQGAGEVSITTNLSFTIANNTPFSQFLRFDSLITPGHIALQGRNSSNLALFRFSVDQITLGNRINLYLAQGYVDTDSQLDDYVRTSDGQNFAGFTEYRDTDRVAFDWGATPLNIGFVVPGFTTSRLFYTSLTIASAGGACQTLLGCEGTQVAFGDPRNDGSAVDPFSASFGAPSSFNGSGNNDQFLIGRQFDPYQGFFGQVVHQGDPLPPALPPPPPPVNYNWLPPVDSLAGAVPEPSSWLMLITGFGLVGATMRRRRHRLA